MILLLIGCKTSPSDNPDQSKRTFSAYNLPVIPVSESTISENYDTFLVEEPRYVVLETNSQSLIGSIDKIEYFQGNYFILDASKAKALFCFDSTGLFKFKIDKVGKGPGEFFIPLDFNIDPRTRSIKIMDPGNRKILEYSIDGELINEFQLEDELKSFYVIDSDIYAMHIDGRNSDWEMSNLLKLWDKNSKEYTIEGVSELGRTDTYPIKNEFSKFEGNILFMHAWTDTIYKVTNASISPIYILDFGQERISREIKELDLMRQRDYFLNNSYKFHKGQLFENHEFVSFKWISGNSGDEKEYVTYYNKDNGNTITIGQVSNWKLNLSLAGPLAFDGKSFIGELIGSTSDINRLLKPRHVEDESNPILVHFRLTVN